jgi:hypothetical protein
MMEIGGFLLPTRTRTRRTTNKTAADGDDGRKAVSLCLRWFIVKRAMGI